MKAVKIHFAEICTLWAPFSLFIYLICKIVFSNLWSVRGKLVVSKRPESGQLAHFTLCCFAFWMFSPAGTNEGINVSDGQKFTKSC